ncbi:MAG: TonB-dependent receptor [Parahaliea sp.]
MLTIKIKSAFCTGVLMSGAVGLGAPEALSQPQEADRPVAANQLEEVMVTARKREESLQEAPLSITAFSRDMIEDRQMLNIGDINNFTPNLQFDSVAPNSGFSNSSAVTVRGIGQDDFVLVVDPGVGIFLDGVYVSRSVGNLFDTADIASIEVLKGPQGTLFGKNTIGGAVVVQSIRPQPGFSASLEGVVGEDSRTDYRGSINIPVNDSLALRANLSGQKRDGYNIRIPSGDDQGDMNRMSGRVSLLYSPNDSFELYLAADYSTVDEKGPAIENLAMDEVGSSFGDF